jgi:hypothetical protein
MTTLDTDLFDRIAHATFQLSLEVGDMPALPEIEYAGFSTSRIAAKVKVGELRDAISSVYFALNDGTYSYHDQRGRIVVISEKLLRVGRALSRLSMIDCPRKSDSDVRQIASVYKLAEDLMRNHSAEFLSGVPVDHLFQWDETASHVEYAWLSSVAYQRLQSLTVQGRHLVAIA